LGIGNWEGKVPLTILQKIQAAEEAIFVFVIRLVDSCVVEREEGNQNRGVKERDGKMSAALGGNSGVGEKPRQGLICQSGLRRHLRIQNCTYLT
jgi:hypothetical protein